ncbi:MAG: tetratricopeptide repeat protein [Pseudoxanthomonas sp.]
MTLVRIFLAAMLALFASAAHAQAVSKPKEFYFDPDALTARRIVAAQGEGDALAAELVRMRERGRKTMEATAHLAHVAMTDSRIELGKTLYEQAVSGTSPDSSIGRSVRWNYAWDLYRNGDFAQAYGLWSGFAAEFGEPAWLPPTLALSLWGLDRKKEAVQWYAAAVRTEPNLWSDPANYPALLPDWREEDRKRLAEVYTAWAANPPAWP